MNNIIILIPPSEGKRQGGSHPPLKKASKNYECFLRQFRKMTQTEWQKTLGVKNKTLEAAIAANKAILSAQTLPAIERYTGVVYNAIDYTTLKTKSQDYFNQHVRIISALFGLVKPQDLIPDYKLKIDKLGADKHWLPLLQKTLEKYFIVDLLPQAHRKAVHYDNGLAVNFLVYKNGRKTPAGHQGKHIKGRFIRYLCEHQIKDPEKIKDFSEEGFTYTDGAFVKHQ